jgi:hypothetical protein
VEFFSDRNVGGKIRPFIWIMDVIKEILLLFVLIHGFN